MNVLKNGVKNFVGQRLVLKIDLILIDNVIYISPNYR